MANKYRFIFYVREVDYKRANPLVPSASIGLRRVDMFDDSNEDTVILYSDGAQGADTTGRGGTFAEYDDLDKAMSDIAFYLNQAQSDLSYCQRMVKAGYPNSDEFLEESKRLASVTAFTTLKASTREEYNRYLAIENCVRYRTAVVGNHQTTIEDGPHSYRYVTARFDPTPLSERIERYIEWIKANYSEQIIAESRLFLTAVKWFENNCKPLGGGI